MFEVFCSQCGEKFESNRISDAMNAKRHHMEQRHLEARIETDTSLSR